MPDILPLGSKAPDFSLEGTNGQHLNSADFRSKKHLVLAFYPKDSTSG
jgi:peroxiredoxin Q/BCP